MDLVKVLTDVVLFTLFCNIQECWSQVKFSFDKGDECYNKEQDLVMTAEYTGQGTVLSFNLYYSGQTSGNNVVDISSCEIFGNPDPGYPNNRLTYSCDTAKNIYMATLATLNDMDDKKEWGATFALQGENSPDIVKKTLILCPDKTNVGAIVGGVVGGAAFIGVVILIGISAYNKWCCFKSC